MNIQNKKFLLNLAKIQTIKAKKLHELHLNSIAQGLNTASIIFYTISNSGDQFTNSSFAFAKDLTGSLQQIQLLSISLITIMLLLNLTVLGSLFILCRQTKIIKQNLYQKDFRIFIREVGAYSQILFETTGILLLVGINSSVDSSHATSLGLTISSLLCMALTWIITLVCKINVPYYNRIVAFLLIIQYLAPLNADSIAIILTVYQIRNEKGQRLVYFVILTTLTLCLCGELLQADISSFHFLFIVATVVVIEQFLPLPHSSMSKQEENDFLLQAIKKMHRDEELSNKQTIQILHIFEGIKAKHSILEKQLGNSGKVNLHSEQFKQISFTDLTQNGLSRLLHLKIDTDLNMNSNNLIFRIQEYQCLLMEQQFSISTLYAVEQLIHNVQNRGIYEQMVLIERLISQIEAKFMKGQQQLDGKLIFRLEKKLEQFYMNVGEAAQNLLTLWKRITEKQLKEEHFNLLLQKIIDAQQRSIRILHDLQVFKDISVESDVVNFLHKIINSDISNVIQKKEVREQDKFFETKFLLLANNKIEDVSRSIAKRIALNQEELLIGSNISQVLYDFYNIYLQQEINKMVSINQNHTPFLIPFKVFNHNMKFLLFQCVIRVLPDLCQGIKCIFHFLNQRIDAKKYCLYCLEDDRIQGLSEAFFERFNVDDSVLPSVILGRSLFNIDISYHISQENIQKNFTIKCELLFNNLRKNIKGFKETHSIPFYLKIVEFYKAKNLNYILFELTTQEETMLITPKQTIRLFVTEHKNFYKTSGNTNDSNPYFCKIHNPLATIIDQKLSRITSNNGLSYFKIIVGLMVLMVLIVIGTFIMVRTETNAAGNIFKQQIQLQSHTNNLISSIYLLFYQYYQYYQINNYPQQFLQIQDYNMTAINIQYHSKANENILNILPKILLNTNPQVLSAYKIFYEDYDTIKSTDKTNLLDFLEDAKQALSTNSPIFMVRNQNVIYQIINSFLQQKDNAISKFTNQMSLYMLGAIGCLIVICIIYKVIHLRICAFKWNIFYLYSTLDKEERKNHKKKLEKFLTLLVSQKYYQIRSNRKYVRPSQQELIYEKIKEERQINLLKSEEKIKTEEARNGISRTPFVRALFMENFLLVIPLTLLLFWLIYTKNMEQYMNQCTAVMNYTSQLQSSSTILLERATYFMQVAMEAVLPESQRFGVIKQQTYKIATEFDGKLPNYFDGYKNIQRMLDSNLCDYAYLNTGSLYKGINCSEILDGMMNQGFTETYSFLLEKFEQFVGVSIQDLGKQFRPHSTYPFFMEVCYARRAINNMLAFIQAQFSVAVSSFLEYKQSSLQTGTDIGFTLIPLLLLWMYLFGRRMHKQCAFAIKCFRILPRNFIMKIGTSKRLRKLGVLEEIQLIIAF